MTAYEKIERAYQEHPKEEPLENYVRWHLRHGFVFSRPDFFCMGRCVMKEAPADSIRDPMHLFPSEDCNAWYIFAAAGNMARMWQILPWPLGWVCWTRLHDPLSELQFVETERLQRLCPPDISRFK